MRDRASYHRTYMRQWRAERRTQRPPTMRDRVLAVLRAYSALTMSRLLQVLGEGYERPGVYYHVRRLVSEGVLTAERTRTGDGSWFLYSLKEAQE